MEASVFWTEVKQLLQRIVIKILVTLQSRKFWAAFFGVLLILQKWGSSEIDPATAMWSIVTIIATYAGFVAAEDIFARK